MNIIGLTRVRNEALIIEDTVRHWLQHVPAIIMWDDCSEDDTVAIAQRAGGDRIHVIRNTKWLLDREAEETRHRAALLKYAQAVGAPWAFYFDADERLAGPLNVPDAPAEVVGFKLRLFDGYMTRTHCDPYRNGPLVDLPRMWGPEYRDILMLFRTNPTLTEFVGKDQRAPRCKGRVVTLKAPLVKHFGKCISVPHWEETCDYYATYFPRRYRVKWAARKGKAIHTLSDFNRTLYSWDQLMEREQSWQPI